MAHARLPCRWPDADSKKIEHACEVVGHMKIIPCTECQTVTTVEEGNEDITTPGDLNIKPLHGERARYFVDIIDDFAGDLQLDAVVEQLKDKNYNDLPVPLRAKCSFSGPHTINVNIHKKTSGTYRIVKLIVF